VGDYTRVTGCVYLRNIESLVLDVNSEVRVHVASGMETRVFDRKHEGQVMSAAVVGLVGGSNTEAPQSLQAPDISTTSVFSSQHQIHLPPWFVISCVDGALICVQFAR